MPADRITSETPWHVMLIIDDSGSMSGESDKVNEALQAMIAEMEVIAKGTKPYFKISIISFGSSAKVIAEAKSERDIDVNKIAVFDGSSGSTNVAEAFRAAADTLRSHPGRPTDFRPYVFFFSDGKPDDPAAALKAATALKELDVAAGQPLVWALGYGGIDPDFMKKVSSDPEFFKELPDPSKLISMFPAIGTIAGAKTGESAINSAIMNL